MPAICSLSLQCTSGLNALLIAQANRTRFEPKEILFSRKSETSADREESMRKTILTILAVGLLVTPARLASQQAEDKDNLPRVLAPHSVVAKKTLGEWSATWWKWAYAIPAND